MKNFYFKGVSLLSSHVQLSLFSQPFSLLKDINYGNPGRCEGTQGQPIQNLMNVNGTLFFTTSSGSLVTPSGLWKSDGTAAGTILIKGDLRILSIIDANGTFFFIINSPNSVDQELWKSDGTEAGTVMVKSFNGLVSELTNVNGAVYFEVFTSGVGEQL